MTCHTADCCGPGSYCCQHTAPHSHDDLRADEIRVALELTLDVYASLTTPIMSDAEATVRAAARAYLVSLEQEPDHAFLPVNGHPDDDECTYRSDGTDDTYCGLSQSAHNAAGFRSQPKGDNK